MLLGAGSKLSELAEGELERDWGLLGWEVEDELRVIDGIVW